MVSRASDAHFEYRDGVVELDNFSPVLFEDKIDAPVLFTRTAAGLTSFLMCLLYTHTQANGDIHT